MKKLLSIFMAMAMSVSLFAQAQAPKGGSLALKVLVEEMVEPFPVAAQAQLENKLNRLLTQNGIASMDYLGQFFITVRQVPLTKDVLATAPIQIATTMEFTFYIADYYNQIVFSTASVTAKGVGQTEPKCYMDAIKHINLNSKELQKFVQEGKAKIIDYYNQQADNMMLRARSLAKQKNFEQALFLMQSIPSECDKYAQAVALGDEIYQMYIDHLCDQNLALARNAWAAEQNSSGAAAAGEYLAQIYPEAKCYGDAMALYQEIKGKVLDDWKFQMKQYQDGVDLERARIDAWRQVGVAYGEGQQPTSTNIGFLR